MTPEQSAMVAFLRDRYAEAISRVRELSNAIVTGAVDLPVSREAAGSRFRQNIHAAEVRSRFFEETVVAYLGTAGPTGRIADQQLRMLAWEHEGHRDFEPSWAP